MTSSGKSSPAEILDLIVAKAPALRKAGVTELELDGFSVKLAAHVADDADDGAATGDATEDTPVGGFDDPALYNLPPGSVVPGFAALREKKRRAKGES